jgi:hypothetical protein
MSSWVTTLGNGSVNLSGYRGYADDEQVQKSKRIVLASARSSQGKKQESARFFLEHQPDGPVPGLCIPRSAARFPGG